MKRVVDFTIGFVLTAIGFGTLPIIFLLGVGPDESILLTHAQSGKVFPTYFPWLLALFYWAPAGGVSIFPIYLAPVFSLHLPWLLELVQWAPAVGVLFLGVVRHRPGFAIAPVAFLSLWLGVSVLTRLRIAEAASPDLYNRQLPESARGHRTLIIEQERLDYPLWLPDHYLVANGHIDRLVRYVIDPGGWSGRLNGLEATTLGRGANCADPKAVMHREFRAAGREDECILVRPINVWPRDGLVVRDTVEKCPGFTKSCWTLRFVLRREGREQVLAVWRSGTAKVLSYLPGWRRVSPNVLIIRNSPWAMGTNRPLQWVSLGQSRRPQWHEIRTALYGIKAGARVKPAPDTRR